MEEDELDFVFPSDYTTTWTTVTTQQRQRKKATYSQKASTSIALMAFPRRNNTIKRRSSTGGSQPFSFPSSFDDRIQEEEAWGGGGESGAFASFEEYRAESFASAVDIPPPPPVPRGKVFRRANSVNTALVPRPPPLLKRSQSVSVSDRNESCHSSFEQSESNPVENFDPNFGSHEDFGYPKRGSNCNYDGSIRGRKKCRSMSTLSFLNNGVSPLYDEPTQFPWQSSGGSNDFHDLDDFESPRDAVASKVIATCGRLQNRGGSLPALPSLSNVNEGLESERSRLLVPKKPISPRKRPLPQLHFNEFCQSPMPSQVSSKPRFLSPNLPTPLNEVQDEHNFDNLTISSEENDDMSDSGSLSVSEDESNDEDLETMQVDGDIIERKILQAENAKVEDIIATMSSMEDLQFLTSNMMKERKTAHAKAWQVALDATWQPERRNAILRWATETLGFTFSNGGGNVSIMRILPSKGKALLDLFENTLVACTGIAATSRKMRHSQTTLPADLRITSPKKQSRMNNHKSACFLPSKVSSNRLQIETQSDSLFKLMKKLTVNDTSPSQDEVPEVDSLLFDIDSNLDDVGDVTRPSIGHHASSMDLMHHLHGTTPTRCTRQQGKPRRSSTQSISSNVTMLSPLPVTNDLITTPRCQILTENWGSRLEKECDWGVSQRCESIVLDVMMKELHHKHPDLLSDGLTGMQTKSRDSSQHIVDQGIAVNVSDECSNPFDDVSTSSRLVVGNSYFGRVQFALSEETSSVMDRGITNTNTRDQLRRQKNFDKRRRTALFASAKNPVKAFREARKSMFVQPTHTSQQRTPKNILSGSSPEFFANKFAQKSNRKLPSETIHAPLDNSSILETILDFLEEKELILTASLVSRKWFEAATNSHSNLMLSSIGCDDGNIKNLADTEKNHALSLMERPWSYLTSKFPWACFLSEGSYKRVYKVFNHDHRVEEAISVMDVEEIRSTGNLNVVGAELAVSVLLGSLVRRGVCPNFVSIRGVFSCPFEPPKSHWGSAENKKPRGNAYISPRVKRQPNEPKRKGRFQYIRMELCDEGDAEEFLKRQPDESLTPCQARNIMFQISFALHAGAEKFSLKHYDLKLLNVFLQRVKTMKRGEVVLRYGLGEHIFSLRAPKDETVIAKLADFGTARVDLSSNDQQVTIAQFTTYENTPPDFLVLGDEARQGHGHDNFGLGLCMLHLFTGHAPYEEILVDVVCPPNLRNELRGIWEADDDTEYSVVRSLVLANVFKDDDGHILEGEPDEVLYDTLYKYLVLFGIPEPPDARILDSRVMTVIKATLTSDSKWATKAKKGRKIKSDVRKFSFDRKKYSLSHGTNRFIARAREALLAMEGGMELLLSLVNFNPNGRARAIDVLNSSFMAPLREMEGCEYSMDDEVMSFTALSTHGETKLHTPLPY